MKTCKKCKKSVPNNVKICIYCGTDLSTIKKATNKNKNLDNKISVTRKKNIEEKIPEVTELLFDSMELHDIQNVIDNKKNIKDKEKINKNKKLNNKKNKVMEDKTELLFDIEEIKKKIGKKTNTKKEKESKKHKELPKYLVDSDTPSILFGSKIELAKKGKVKEIKIKNNLLKSKIKELRNKDKNVRNKNLSKKNKLDNKEKKEIIISKNLTRAQKLKKKKRRMKLKKILFVFGIVLVVFSLVYFGYHMLLNYENRGYKVKVGDYKVFQIGDIISYKNIKYRVTNVKISNGTSYKKPKEGNQFLIITLNFENDSEEKYRYSSDDWTLIDSLGEETTRIITPINAGSALYSGYLVVGANKTASIVFEAPISDEKLKLRYYDPLLKENSEEENIKEQDKKNNKKKPKGLIFSVEIKVSEEE